MDFYRFPPHATDDLFLELAVPETSYRHSPRGVRAENKFALEGRIVIGSDSHHENNNEKKKKVSQRRVQHSRNGSKDAESYSMSDRFVPSAFEFYISQC